MSLFLYTKMQRDAGSNSSIPLFAVLESLCPYVNMQFNLQLCQ